MSTHLTAFSFGDALRVHPRYRWRALGSIKQGTVLFLSSIGPGDSFLPGLQRDDYLAILFQLRGKIFNGVIGFMAPYIADLPVWKYVRYSPEAEHLRLCANNKNVTNKWSSTLNFGWPPFFPVRTSFGWSTSTIRPFVVIWTRKTLPTNGRCLPRGSEGEKVTNYECS